MRLLLVLFLPLLLFAFKPLPEHLPYYNLTTEKALSTVYEKEIDPHFSTGIDGFFKGENNLSIHYMLFRVKDEKGAIVVANGRTESILKYKEFIYDMNRNGYSLYLIDHRGQGLSGRMLKDDQMGYVEKFENYVLDLHTFIVKKVKPLKPKHLFVLGHSMGGAIIANYLEAFDDGVDAAILTSPMLQPNLFTPRTSGLLCKAMSLEQNDKEYAPGQTTYDAENNVFKENLLTHSRIRFNLMNHEIEKHPKTKIGGPSIGWIKAACRGSKNAVDNAAKVRLPLLILRGSEDAIVNPKAEDMFCKEAPQCVGYEIEGAWHELLIEKDRYREEAMRAILTFLDLVLQEKENLFKVVSH